MVFDTIEEINAYFEQWPEYDDNRKLKTIRDLRQHGSLSKASYPSKVTYNCPVYHFKLVKPCGLTECPYNRTNPESHNCLLKAVHETKQGRLSVGDISNLLDIPVGRVNQLNNTSTIKIRRALLKDKLSAYTIPKFQYLPGHCINCEVSMHEELGLDSSDEDLISDDISILEPELVYEANRYGWCSHACKAGRPAWIFELEREFGYNVRDLLRISLDVLSKPEVVDELFGLDKGTTTSMT